MMSMTSKNPTEQLTQPGIGTIDVRIQRPMLS